MGQREISCVTREDHIMTARSPPPSPPTSHAESFSSPVQSVASAFFFETFDYRDKQEWMSRNWHLSFYGTAAYLLAIFVGQWLMRGRKPYELRGALTFWNIILAAFSIAATARTLPELIGILLSPQGFHHSVCSPCEDVTPASAFWAWAFVMSKLVELGDTAFIVLRKQPLIFLHWYHHMTVLLYSWYSYGDYIAPARWFVVMNYLVHSLMYTYYACKSLRLRIPKPISMTITCLQLSQMVVGVSVNVYAYRAKNAGLLCDVPYHHLNLGLSMYASYFALFANFFYKAYFEGKKQRAAVAAAVSAKENKPVAQSTTRSSYNLRKGSNQKKTE